MTTLDDLLTRAQRLASVQAEVNADRQRLTQGLTNSTDWELGLHLLDAEAGFQAALDAYIDERVRRALARHPATARFGGNP